MLSGRFVDRHTKASHGGATATVSIVGNRVAVVGCGDYERIPIIGVIHSVLDGLLIRYTVLEPVARASHITGTGYV